MNISEVQRAGEGQKIVRREINKWMDREVKHRSPCRLPAVWIKSKRIITKDSYN